MLIADDQPLMCTALRTILEADGIRVVGEAGDGEAVLRSCAGLSPDVVLMDVRMPGRDGLSATAELARRSPSIRVLVLTTFDDDATLFGALRVGAAGFLLKNSGPEQLQQAVRRVAAGDSVLDPVVTARVMRRFAAPAAAAAPAGAAARAGSAAVVGPGASVAGADDIARLTEREKDVLALLAAGASNVEIADRLSIGEATAKTHVSHVILKLGVRDRLQAVIRAYESGFTRQPRAVQPRSDKP